MRKFYHTSMLVLLFAITFTNMQSYAFNQERMYDKEEVKKEPKITIADNRLIVENISEETVLEIFSIVGVKVFSVKVKEGRNEFSLSLPKGYYIIRVGNTAKKIALR